MTAIVKKVDSRSAETCDHDCFSCFARIFADGAFGRKRAEDTKAIGYGGYRRPAYRNIANFTCTSGALYLVLKGSGPHLLNLQY